MRRRVAALLGAVMVATAAGGAAGVAVAPLRLVQQIPLPEVRGRIDHLAVDLEGRRLFVAALGNNTVEVVDLETGTRVRTLHGFDEPQAVLYLEASRRLVVSNGGDGAVDLLDGRSLTRTARVVLSGDADNLRYDSGTIYVGYGGGAVGAIDAKSARHIGDIGLAGHPESFQLDGAASRVYVNVPEARHVAVGDLRAGRVMETWPVPDARANFPMALDAPLHRLLIATRRPARLVVFDTGSGQVVQSLEAPGDADDVFVDAERRRVYVSGGDGVLGVYERQGAGRLALAARIPTGPGARTSLFVPEQSRLYVAVPATGGREAEIQVFAAEP